MDADSVKNNINKSIKGWHDKNIDGSYQAVVCITCDQFILPNSTHYLTLHDLNKYQHLLYPNPEFGLSNDLCQCYRVSFPDIEIPEEIVNSLQIEYCLLSPRSSFNLFDSQEHGFNICKKCHISLKKNKMPKFCIANNYCFGDTPTCLVELTEVERAVI
jgi:hypothetical protein